MNTRTFLIVLVTVVIAGGIGLLIIQSHSVAKAPAIIPTTDTPLPVEPDGGIGDTPTPLSEEVSAPATNITERSIGTSVGGREIMAYHFGTGDRKVLFVGGTHGGYSWNTTALAYELIDYLDANPNAVPESVRVTVIPVLNPDGLLATIGTTGRFDINRVSASEATRIAGRFNGNEVDINRNFDCEWSAEGTWQSRTVRGGSAPFSEPEAAALRDYVLAEKPSAAVVWFSAEGRVYPSACGSTPSRASVSLADTFALAADYPTGAEFVAYPVTGDMVNWMAKESVPAISVLLSNHTSTDWERNLAGALAVIQDTGN
jgi:hypothetical protein